MREGLGAVNANAYAGGLSQSGATYKALQNRGMGLADQSAQQWGGNLMGLAGLGQNAFGTIAGVGQNTTNNITNAMQNGADAQGNAALVNGNNWSQILQGIGNAGAYAYGSSYQQPGQSGGYAGQAPRSWFGP